MIIAWTKWMEKKCACSNFLVNLYGLYYRETVKKEIELAEVRENDRILCIGGGSIPSTAIQMANLTKAEIDVIDMDPKAVINARKLINRIGLDGQVSILQGKGEDMDVGCYDVIHVALQVSPKEKVVDHLWANSKKGTRIIVRMPKKKLKSFYSCLSSKFLCKVKACTKKPCLGTSFTTMDQALLLIKS